MPNESEFNKKINDTVQFLLSFHNDIFQNASAFTCKAINTEILTAPLYDLR